MHRRSRPKSSQRDVPTPISTGEQRESEFLIADDIAGELGADFGSLLANIGDDHSLGHLRGQLEKLDSQKAVRELPSQAKENAVNARINYEETKKETAQWIPQIRRNATAEQVCFGELATDLRPSTSSLVADFRPANAFEAELDSAIKASGVTEDIAKELKVLHAATPIELHRQSRQVARLKAILFREQQKNKRVKKIKSRMWRKINRKSELAERERLLEKLAEDSPELAQKIRQDFEEKRARMRMMKQQNARRKWAAAAIRFGGKEMQRVVSREFQEERDEKDALSRIVKAAPGTAMDTLRKGNDDDSSTSDDEDVEGDVHEVLSKAKHSVEQTLEDDLEDEPGKKKGVAGMKFMQAAAERRRKERERQAAELLEEIAELEELTKEEGEFISKQSKEQSHSTSDVASKLKDRLEKFNNRQSENPIEQGKGEAITSTTATKASVTVSGPIDVPAPKRRKIGSAESGSLEQASSKKPVMATSDAISDLVDSMVAEGALAHAVEQEALIQEAFVTEETDALQTIGSLQQEDDENEAAKEKPIRMAGWGNWVGEGIRTFVNEPNQPPKRREYKQTMYINRKLDRKLAPYFVKSLPHPFASKEHFEASRAHPLGPEWNTHQVHKRLIQPDVHVRSGTVIMPLEYAKKLPEEQADSLLDAWSLKAKKNAPKARL